MNRTSQRVGTRTQLTLVKPYIKHKIIITRVFYRAAHKFLLVLRKRLWKTKKYSPRRIILNKTLGRRLVRERTSSSMDPRSSAEAGRAAAGPLVRHIPGSQMGYSRHRVHHAVLNCECVDRRHMSSTPMDRDEKGLLLCGPILCFSCYLYNNVAGGLVFMSIPIFRSPCLPRILIVPPNSPIEA